MKSVRFVLALVVALGLVFTTSLAFAAGGGGGGEYGGGSGGSVQRSSRSPELISKRYYKAGLRHKAKAWKLEEKAAKEDDLEDRDKLLAKVRKSYEKAIVAQSAAMKAFASNYEAANELGYALRKTGSYEKAIASYDRALELNAVYFPAVEYRAEAYLATGQLDKAKRSYMALFRNDRKLAHQLMTAMDEWLAKQAAGDSTASFAEWLKERKALADVGDDLSQNNTRSW